MPVSLPKESRKFVHETREDALNHRKLYNEDDVIIKCVKNQAYYPFGEAEEGEEEEEEERGRWASHLPRRLVIPLTVLTA